MNFVQMDTGLLMVMQQLDASSQGVSDVPIYVVQPPKFACGTRTTIFILRSALFRAMVH